MLYKKANARLNEEFRITASLHGIELKAPSSGGRETIAESKLTPEQKAAQERALQAAQERVRQRIAGKHG